MIYCLTWISDLWKHVFCESLVSSSGTSISSLPDDIITDILARLSTKNVLTCKLVHSQWHPIFC
ncbi:hypothetical protein SOVF_172320 [Spinacia oleracea]|nr:hypothetical protein SOVF_172320 [Spinacia oleracea]